jgi:diguanylate cyclase (GGDEF)-like protein
MPFSASSRLDDRTAAKPTFGSAFRDLAPFAATASLAWVVVLFGNSINWAQYGGSVALVFASWSLGLVVVVRGHARNGIVGGSLGFLAAVGLMRNAAGGSNAGVTTVSLLAVFQTALYLRHRRDLVVVLVGLAAFYLVPIVAVGPPHYPHSGYRGALLAVIVSSIIGLMTQTLVMDIRRRAIGTRHNALMLMKVNQTIQRLFDSPNAREDVCVAITEISGAKSAILFEPTIEPDVLRYSAGTLGGAPIPLDTPAALESAVQEAFETGSRVLITEDTQSRVGNVEMWRAVGSPSSILYEPLSQRGTALGVLVIGWDDVADLSDPRIGLASLLAHEGAAVIARADVIDHLTDEAHTDPLTHLHNRRAWNVRLGIAMGENQALAVAMLDLDHFKLFNDTYGHPAGDRLLEDTAAAWRAEIRGMDFLARLGGEEFGLLMFSADAEATLAIVNRLRAKVPDNQTCSAGIAFRTPGETAEELVHRADQALYEAKSLGRDTTSVSTGPIAFHPSRSTGSQDPR